MRAVVLTDARKIQLQDVPPPTPGPGEVLIKPELVGICGTDLHATELSIFRPPVVLGHEFGGVVVDAGPGVHGWEPGDRVAVNPNGNVCGTCDSCRSGNSNLCRTAIADNPAGVARDGGMAELVSLPTAYLHRLPDDVDAIGGAWVEPLAVALRAVRESGLRVGDSAVVIGAGPVGQLVSQVLQNAGAASVVVIEPSRFRRDVARNSGASSTLAPDEAAVALADGALDPPAYVFECSGAKSALALAVDLVAPKGHIRLVGVAAAPVSFEPLTALMKEVVITTNFIYVDEFPAAIGLLRDRLVDVGELTTALYPFERIHEAFDALRQPEASIKILLGPDIDA